MLWKQFWRCRAARSRVSLHRLKSQRFTKVVPVLTPSREFSVVQLPAPSRRLASALSDPSIGTSGCLMTMSLGKGAVVAVPRFQSALRKLAVQGSAALKPALISSPDDTTAAAHWKPALISNRVASVLRKQAIQEGTYGSFNTATLRGWDSNWDVELATARSKGSGRIKLRPPNKTSRQRTREKRAAKIESTMQDMGDRIETYYLDKQKAKPASTFENNYKQQMLVKR